MSYYSTRYRAGRAMKRAFAGGAASAVGRAMWDSSRAAYGAGKKYVTTMLGGNTYGARVPTKYLRMYPKRRYSTSEKKYKDSALGGPVGQEGDLQVISNVAQGTGIQARIGNQIHIESVYISGEYVLNGNYTGGQIMQTWLILDMQTVSDTQPSFSTIFTDYSGINDFLNLDNLGRFKILWSHRQVIDREELSVTWQANVKCNVLVRFNGTAGSDIQKNAIYLVTASNVPANNANKPNYNTVTRIKFRDG